MGVFGNSIERFRCGPTALLLCSLAAATAQYGLSAQSPTFDVVSIKRSDETGRVSSNLNRPDGGLVISRLPVTALLQRAYPSVFQGYIVGLPNWAKTDLYDVTATASHPVSMDEQAEMIRAMLLDRFQLAAHVEDREQLVYRLVRARGDGELGPKLRRTPVDCDAIQAKQRAEADTAREARTAAPPPPLDGPPAPCALRFTYGRPGGDRLEGDATMARLASRLFENTGREVLDETGLTGYYRFELVFDRKAAFINTAPPESPGAGAVIYTALEEQLGLKLTSAKIPRPTLVVERLERPTPN